MIFWEVKFRHTVSEDGDYPYDKQETPNYFSTMEECMAFVLSQDHLDVSCVEITRRSLGTWKSHIVLNDDTNRKVR